MDEKTFIEAALRRNFHIFTCSRAVTYIYDSETSKVFQLRASAYVCSVCEIIELHFVLRTKAFETTTCVYNSKLLSLSWAEKNAFVERLMMFRLKRLLKRQWMTCKSALVRGITMKIIFDIHLRSEQVWKILKKNCYKSDVSQNNYSFDVIFGYFLTFRPLTFSPAHQFQ